MTGDLGGLDEVSRHVVGGHKCHLWVTIRRPSQRFIGQKAEVVINPETNQVVSVNPTSTKKFGKLVNEIENVKNKAE